MYLNRSFTKTKQDWEKNEYLVTWSTEHLAYKGIPFESYITQEKFNYGESMVSH